MSERAIGRSGRPRRAGALRAGLLLAAVAWSTTTTALHEEAGTLGDRGGSAPRARPRDFSSGRGAGPQAYREYSEVRQRRPGGKDPASTRSDFHHGLLGYDPASDPIRELQAAVEKAKTRNARILVVVGGEWCSWCHILDRFVKGNDEIRSLWERNFVTLKVHFDPETPNEEFLGHYPEIQGYPHIFVLDAAGAFLHSQNTAHLEEGDSYSTERLLAFLMRWAPTSTPPD